MKRIITIGILPLVLGLVGAVLRGYELAFAFDTESGLMVKDLAVTPSLIGLSIIAVIVFIFLAFTFQPPTPNPEAEANHPVFFGVSIVAFLMLLTFSGFLFYSCMTEFVLTQLIYGVLTLICAISICVLGVKRLRDRDSGIYAILTVAPVFWACYALILIFRERISDPIILDYIYPLFGFICILLFLYSLSGYVFGKDKQRLTIVTASMGLYFCLIDVVSPFIAKALSPDYLTAITLGEFIPLLTFAIYLPFAANLILKNENRVDLVRLW